MPSASNKTENKAPQEVLDPFKAAQSVVEKKVRNLEKRKGKLDLIREKRDQGEQLNSDQQKAIDAYDAVITSLEVTRDLQKQFSEIQNDLDKQLKKQARKEKKERADKRASDVRRLHDVLQLQSLLDCMGTETVRSHFKTGKNNALVLTEANLNQLDELYKLISPSREEPKYEDQLEEASEHVFSYLDAREDDVAGSTYKDLKKLLDDIVSCGYFDKYPYEEAAPAPEEPAVTATIPATIAEPEAKVEQEKVHEEPPQEVPESRVEEPVHQAVVEPVLSHAPAVPTTDMTKLPMDDDSARSQFEDDSFFSTPTFPAEQRPFQDIVSSVQGTFNFLQESHIANENSAPHLDPAVVAAQPMASSLHKSQTDTMRGTSFQGVSMLSNDDLTQQLAQSTQQQQQQQTQQQQAPHTSDRLGSDPGSANASQQSGTSSLDAAYAASPADYSQNLMAQNLATGSAAHSYGEQAPSGLGHSHSHTHSGMDQSVVMGSGMSAAPDMAHSLALTGQSNLQDQGISQDSQEKKPFTMNPNAAMFQSMYNSGMSHNQNNSQMSQSMGNNNMHNDKGMNHQNEYHSNGFGNRFGDRSGGPRSGSRGGGGRGGRGGMSNGYARNGSRGGGGSYGNSGGRGGNFNSRGGSGRGGAYHGYPPRSDYRPEGGYQGYNSGYNNGAGFKRGGGSGGSGDRSSGSTSSNSSGTGAPRGNQTAMRSGPPRGGSGDRGGDRGGRGAARGGYSRPSAVHQSA